MLLYKKISNSIPVIIMAGIFFYSCTNDMEEVKIVANTESQAIRATYNAEFIFTDSADIKNKLNSNKLEIFETADSSYTVLSKGFKLTFYENDSSPDGILTARNGFINQDNSVMIARDSVVFVNRDGETLRTEELYWLQDSDKVYTDKFVIIEKKDAIINGKGLISNQNFTNYRIKEPTGIIYMNDDDDL